MIKITFNSEKEKYLDYVHFGFGIVIFIMAVLSLINPTENIVLFPFIFLLAGLLYLFIFIIDIFFTKMKIKASHKLLRIGYLCFSVFLIFMFLVSKTIIWG